MGVFKQPEQAEAELRELAAKNPRAAILSAWSLLESQLSRYGQPLQTKSATPWQVRVANVLVDNDVFRPNDAQAVDLLFGMRNAVAHGVGQLPTEEHATKLVQVAIGLAKKVATAIERESSAA